LCLHVPEFVEPENRQPNGPDLPSGVLNLRSTPTACLPLSSPSRC